MIELIHPVHIKRCHWFFRSNFCKYWRIFIIFRAKLRKINAKVIGARISCHTFVMLLPYRVKVSDTKVTHFTRCYIMFISITFRGISIDETNITQQKVRGSKKIMLKMSTIHANTCIQTTTPLRNRWCDDGVVQQPPLSCRRNVQFAVCHFLTFAQSNQIRQPRRL